MATLWVNELKRFGICMLIILAVSVAGVTLLESNAFAAGPPTLFADCPTGNIAPWGQPEVKWASLVIDEGFSTDQGFSDTSDNKTYLAFERWTQPGVALQTIATTPGFPDLYYGSARLYIWSGPDEIRDVTQVTLSAYGPYRYEIWSDEPGVLDPIVLTDGQQHTFDLLTVCVGSHAEWQNAHAFTVGITAVPEPGSLIAILTGLIGTVGFIRRRTHP